MLGRIPDASCSCEPSSAGGGSKDDAVGWKDICVAVSGGLISLLEVVSPLWHVGCASMRPEKSETGREIQRMMRAPPAWAKGLVGAVKVKGTTSATDIGGARGGASSRGMRNASTSSGIVVTTPSNSFLETTDSAERAHDSGDTPGVLLLCDGGWVGWYRWSYNFEVRRAKGICSRTIMGMNNAIRGYFDGRDTGRAR